MSKDSQPLTQVEFDEADFPIAERIAKRLGYTQTAYTSSSALWGLFCLPDNPHGVPTTTARRFQHACIIKTKELGLLVVQDLEDLHLDREGRPE